MFVVNSNTHMHDSRKNEWKTVVAFEPHIVSRNESSKYIQFRNNFTISGAHIPRASIKSHSFVNAVISIHHLS